MKNQTPKFTSLVQAIGIPTLFAAITAQLVYIAYDEEDIPAGIAAGLCAGITGLAIQRAVEYLCPQIEPQNLLMGELSEQ